MAAGGTAASIGECSTSSSPLLGWLATQLGKVLEGWRLARYPEAPRRKCKTRCFGSHIVANTAWGGHYRGIRRIARPARPVEAPTSRFDSRGCPADVHPRPRAEEAGRTSSTRLLQLADVERLPRAKNEIWYQGSETPRSGRRVTRVVSQAARGALEHASSPPLSSTLCAMRAQAVDAAQGQPGREGRR